MKGLILKDMYYLNMHMLVYFLTLGIWVFVFSNIIDSSGFHITEGSSGYLIIAQILLITSFFSTFSEDNSCKWNRYASVLPVSRRQIAAAKFAVMVIWGMTGIAFAVLIKGIGEFVMNQFSRNTEAFLIFVKELPLLIIIYLLVGGAAIPLAFKYGHTKVRICLAVIFGVFLGIVRLFEDAFVGSGIEINEFLRLLTSVCGLPVWVILWDVIMYYISCRILEKEDL